MPELLPLYLNPNNAEGVEPAPNSTLINDASNITLSITPGKTYRLRVIAMGNFVAHRFAIDGHQMTIIAVDSVKVHPTTASSIYVAVGQRYDVLFTAKPTATKNYFFISSIDTTMIGGDYSITYPNAYGYLVYNPSLPLPAVSVPSFNPIDDFGLVPLDNQSILSHVDRQIVINMDFANDAYDINRFVSCYNWVLSRIAGSDADFLQSHHQWSNLCSTTCSHIVHSTLSSSFRCHEPSNLR